MGGDSRCAGTLELSHQGDWRPVGLPVLTLKDASVVCKDLDCGSVVSVREKWESLGRSVWRIRPDCVQSGSALRDCATSSSSFSILDLTCSGKSLYDIIYDIINDSIGPGSIRTPSLAATAAAAPTLLQPHHSDICPLMFTSLIYKEPR